MGRGLCRRNGLYLVHRPETIQESRGEIMIQRTQLSLRLEWAVALPILLGLAPPLMIYGQTGTPLKRPPVTVTVSDENGIPVSDALVTVFQQVQPPVEFHTNHAGRIEFTLTN